MKLKGHYIDREIADSHVIVPVGDESPDLHGFIRGNETAAFIMQCFQDETTPENVADELVKEYAVSHEVALQAVQYMITELNKMGIII